MGLPQIVNKMEWKNSDSSTSFMNDILIDKSLTVKGNIILGDNATDTLQITGVSRVLNGHIYLEGSAANSSTANTTQVVFGKSNDQHIVISSNKQALILNPSTTTTTDQIVLYLETQSKFPGGLSTHRSANNTYSPIIGGDITANGNITGKNGTLTSLIINDGGNITLNQNEKDQFINFLYTGTSAGYDWRIGHLGTGSGDGNYFVIQSNGTTASTWNNALRLGLTTLDAQFGGNVYPASNNTKTLGTSERKWKAVYAETFNGALSGNATTSSYPLGFQSNGGNITWGTLKYTDANGYTTVARWDSPNGGSVAFADGPMSDANKKSQTSMAIDGYFYQEEGNYKVLDVRNVTGTVNKIPKFTATNTIGDSNLIDNGTEISTSSKFSITGGLKVSGRYAGGGDDEGIVFYPANNQYAGICLGEPTGKRTVLYLMPDGTSVWRWFDGTSTHNLYHPGISGRVLALPSAGTTNKLLKFTGNYQANSSNITDDGSTITLGSKVVVQGNGGSYNEGIRILPASNGWSNIFFSGDASTSGTHNGGWLIGRRGTAGNFAGDIGDFTIENNESNGSGLTLHKNGNMTLYGNTINIAKKVQLFYNSTDKSLDFIFN